MWVCDLFVDGGIISWGQISTEIGFLLTSLHKSAHRGNTATLPHNWWQRGYIARILLDLILGQSQDSKRETVSIPDSRLTGSISINTISSLKLHGKFETLMVVSSEGRNSEICQRGVTQAWMKMTLNDWFFFVFSLFYIYFFILLFLFTVCMTIYIYICVLIYKHTGRLKPMRREELRESNIIWLNRVCKHQSCKIVVVCGCKNIKVLNWKWIQIE